MTGHVPETSGHDTEIIGHAVPKYALRGHGLDAEATRQAMRGRSLSYQPLWRIKAREEGRLRTVKTSIRFRAPQAEAMKAWAEIGSALSTSPEKADRDLATSIFSFIHKIAAHKTEIKRAHSPENEPAPRPQDVNPSRWAFPRVASVTLRWTLRRA